MIRFDFQKNILSFAFGIFLCQATFSGVEWLMSHSGFALVEIIAQTLVSLLLIYIDKQHLRAFYGFLTLSIMSLLLSFPLIRWWLNFSLTSNFNFVFIMLSLIAIIIQLVVSYMYYEKKNNVFKQRGGISKKLDVVTGKWYFISALKVSSEASEENSLYWNIARFTIPLGSILGMFIYRYSNSLFSISLYSLMIFSLINVFVMLVSMYLSLARNIVEAEKIIKMKIGFYWS